MIPPPRMTSRRGTSVCARSPVESTQRGASIPGIGGRTGYEPVATMALLKVTSSPPSTAIVFGAGELPLALDPLDAVRLEEGRDPAGHLVDDGVLPRRRRCRSRASALPPARRASRTSPPRRGTRARSAPTPSSGCTRRAGTCRRARAPARCRRPCRRAVRRGSPPCTRRGRLRGRRRRRSFGIGPFVRRCVGSMAASIVSESASSPTWEKPWRS